MQIGSAKSSFMCNLRRKSPSYAFLSALPVTVDAGVFTGRFYKVTYSACQLLCLGRIFYPMALTSEITSFWEPTFGTYKDAKDGTLSNPYRCYWAGFSR
jgi:hypothetical protein